MPRPNINHENFSVRWTTFLKAPITGTYKFTTISDDGAALFLNNIPVIKHNMHGASDPQVSWIKVMHNEPDAKSPIIESKDI